MIRDRLALFSPKERVIDNVPLRKLPSQLSPIVDTSEFYSPLGKIIIGRPYGDLSEYPVVGRVSVVQQKSRPLGQWHSTRIVE